MNENIGEYILPDVKLENVYVKEEIVYEIEENDLDPSALYPEIDIEEEIKQEPPSSSAYQAYQEFKCLRCSFTTNFFHEIEHHTRSCPPEPSKPCKNLPQTTPDTNQPVIYYPHNSFFKCTMCSQKFKHEKFAIAHARVHIDAKSPVRQSYRCTVCNERFRFEGAAKNHMLAHLGVFAHNCTFCNEGFATTRELVTHSRKHTGEKPFACSKCDQAFADRDELRAHSFSHKQKYLYKCDVCGREFKTVTWFMQHKKTHKEKMFKCGICNEGFDTNADLLEHVQIHGEVDL